ncbi:pantoate--beta-alanine ligase [Gammaproteobacteria bacterium]|nr:pantoate--beta-alanine ligase [Gammaproteobacteria bacterium]
MEIIKSSSTLNSINFQNPFAFVPTMGNLHEGHLSLIKFAKENYSEVIASIFVNPLQFGKNEDFASYPKTLDKDIQLLEDLECNYLFLPEPDFAENLEIINPNFSDVLCGLSRPTHFHGVLTIIDKFLRLIKPNACLLGQKDYQQQLIIRDYVHRKKLRTDIISLPIVRENSGLAMSSRNNYLSQDDREYCGKIYSCIKNTAESLKTSSVNIATEQAINFLQNAGFEIDYLEVVDANNLSLITKKTNKMLIAVAVIYKKVRLIDNIVVYL